MEAVVPADIVLKTTALFTAEELEPHAGCVAVRGSEIVAVGSPDKVQPFIGPDTEVIDAGNKLVHARIQRFAHALCARLNPEG